MNKGWKFVWLLAVALFAWTAKADDQSWKKYSSPYELPVVAIPEGGGVEHFFGKWGALDDQRRGVKGALTIGPERIGNANYARIYDKSYKVLRVTREYAIIVVHYENPVRDGSLTQFYLLTLRRDPKDGEIRLFRGLRDDFRLNDNEPLTRTLDFYRHLLDTPNERVLPPYAGPWGQWSFTVYAPYKN
jgi:hypothetical protein